MTHDRPELAPVRAQLRWRHYPRADAYANAAAALVTLAGIAGWTLALARIAH
jgi:hypothetical protein